MFKKANDIMDVKQYSDAVEQANIVYAKALPYMEKALNAKPTILLNGKLAVYLLQA